MTHAQPLQPPFVVVELDRDSDLAFFRELGEILEDSFDCLWDEAYEAWDATGRRFWLRRTEKPQHWLKRLCGVDPAPLSVDQVEEEAAPEAIRVRLVRWLAEVFGVQPPPGRSFEEMSLGELVSLAVSTEERRAQRR